MRFLEIKANCYIEEKKDTNEEIEFGIFLEVVITVPLYLS